MKGERDTQLGCLHRLLTPPPCGASVIMKTDDVGLAAQDSDVEELRDVTQAQQPQLRLHWDRHIGELCGHTACTRLPIRPPRDLPTTRSHCLTPGKTG